MTRTEHLLGIIAEECAEIAQRASKAQRFGLSEIQPGQSLTNAQRISEEYTDLVAVILMLNREYPLSPISDDKLEAKRVKVEHFLKYSKQCGTID